MEFTFGGHVDQQNGSNENSARAFLGKCGKVSVEEACTRRLSYQKLGTSVTSEY